MRDPTVRSWRTSRYSWRVLDEGEQRTVLTDRFQQRPVGQVVLGVVIPANNQVSHRVLVTIVIDRPQLPTLGDGHRLHPHVQF